MRLCDIDFILGAKSVLLIRVLCGFEFRGQESISPLLRRRESNQELDEILTSVIVKVVGSSYRDYVSDKPANHYVYWEFDA